MRSRLERSSSSLIPFWAVVAAIVTGAGLFVALMVAITRSALENDPPLRSALAQVTVIPAPTVTPTVPVSSEPRELSVRYVSPEGFSIGAFVKIANMQGAGLKIRPEPGTGSQTSFIANKDKLFVITDGPDERNGYTWWKLAGFENSQ